MSSGTFSKAWITSASVCTYSTAAAVARWVTVVSARSRVADTGNTRTQENDIFLFTVVPVFSLFVCLLCGYPPLI